MSYQIHRLDLHSSTQPMGRHWESFEMARTYCDCLRETYAAGAVSQTIKLAVLDEIGQIWHLAEEVHP